MESKLYDKIRAAGMIIGALGLIGFMGLIWLMIYGNLSGNLGFSEGTQGYNDTEAVIGNLTGGYRTFFGFSGTFFTIAAITLLIFMFVGLISVVYEMQARKGNKDSGGFSGY